MWKVRIFKKKWKKFFQKMMHWKYLILQTVLAFFVTGADGKKSIPALCVPLSYCPPTLEIWIRKNVNLTWKNFFRRFTLIFFKKIECQPSGKIYGTPPPTQTLKKAKMTAVRERKLFLSVFFFFKTNLIKFLLG